MCHRRYNTNELSEGDIKIIFIIARVHTKLKHAIGVLNAIECLQTKTHGEVGDSPRDKQADVFSALPVVAVT